MTLACIDIGNTHTHIGVWEKGEFLQLDNLSSKEWIHKPEALKKYLQHTEADSLTFASVVPSAVPVLLDVAHSLKTDYYHLNHKTCPGLPIHYPKPSEIGEDRLANAIAAAHLYHSPAIVIDMGTAVTFDVIDQDGAYEGGIIAPGIQVMTRYLHEQTALLPEIDESDLLVDHVTGKSTQEAMQVGCVIGFSGMIHALLDSLLQECANKYSTPVTLLGTGGSAAYLLHKYFPDIIIDKELSLRGLAYAYQSYGNPSREPSNVREKE